MGRVTLQTIADETVVAPGYDIPFEGATDPGIAGDYVAFVSGDQTYGLYLYNLRDGGLHRVIAEGQTVDGKTVSVINKRESYMIADDRIGVGLTFTDGTNGIYIVEIAAP